MKKLSHNYLTDTETGIDVKLEQYLDAEYLRKLDNLQYSQEPKVVVVFSGGNAVGKSAVAQMFKDRFHALVLENDEIKRKLMQKLPDMDKKQLNKITWQYSMNLYKRLSDLTPNGLIVRDAVIDWYYDRILPIFKQQGYRLFIIAYDISPTKSIELIKARGDTPTVKEDRFYRIVDEHRVHQKRFRQEYTPNLVLTDDTVFEQDTIMRSFEQFMSEIKPISK